MSVHIQCQAFIYSLSLCRGHSWRVRLAKQETLTPPGHLVSPLICRGPGETRCPGGVSVSCLASRTRHECPMYKMQLTLVTGSLVSHEIYSLWINTRLKVHISVWTIREYPKRHFSYLSDSEDTFLPLTMIIIAIKLNKNK